MNNNYRYNQDRKKVDEKKKGVLSYLKVIFLPNPKPYKAIWKGSKFLFGLIPFKLIGKGLSRLLDFIVWPIIYPFLSIKNFFKSILVIVAFIYFGLSIFVINDYLQKRYSDYQKYSCQTKTEEKLKKSVVRIVGGNTEGSGFFIHGDQILTNFHVIDGEPSPKIIFPDGHFITPVKITGNQGADLAILYTENNYYDLVFSLPEEISFKPNDLLISAGYPLGTDINGPPTIIKGNYLEYRKSRKEEVGYIQTDFSLVVGMSGGPLTDICGDVAGINTISMSGQSLFIAADVAKKLSDKFTDQEITKIEVNPDRSPDEAVKAFYTYLKARRMKDGYDLLSTDYKKWATYEEWTNRFNDIIDVTVISTSLYNNSKDTAYIKFWTKNWVYGEVEYHYYQGTWQTVKEGNIFKLKRSNIEEVVNPEWDWYY
jgi:hypothetical protein